MSQPDEQPEPSIDDLVSFDDVASPEDTSPLESSPALVPPNGADPFVEPSRIDPMTAATEPDKGTKLFVLFFFLIVPPLGMFILAAVCWALFKKFMEA
jgi:hypothetical protein